MGTLKAPIRISKRRRKCTMVRTAFFKEELSCCSVARVKGVLGQGRGILFGLFVKDRIFLKKVG